MDVFVVLSFIAECLHLHQYIDEQYMTTNANEYVKSVSKLVINMYMLHSTLVYVTVKFG